MYVSLIPSNSFLKTGVRSLRTIGIRVRTFNRMDCLTLQGGNDGPKTTAVHATHPTNADKLTTATNILLRTRGPIHSEDAFNIKMSEYFFCVR